MNKRDLVVAILEATKYSYTAKDVADISNTMLDVIAEALVKGDDVQLLGFGSFRPTIRPERQGRNPQSGESLLIPESTTIRFKMGKALKHKLNK